MKHPPRSKRLVDLVVASGLLVLLSPLLALIAIAIKLTSRGPILFVQHRVGLHGREFPLYKFRTMIVGAASQGLGIEIAARDTRITRVGHWLRRWSLDELPQLWNIVRGQMSLIGPRPSLPEQVARYTPQQRRRLDALPGLTGWAQINGRNDRSWDERIQLDCWYIEHWSWALEWRIIRGTWRAVVDLQGIYGSKGTVRDLGKEDS